MSSEAAEHNAPKEVVELLLKVKSGLRQSLLYAFGRLKEPIKCTVRAIGITCSSWRMSGTSLGHLSGPSDFTVSPTNIQLWLFRFVKLQ